MATYLKENDTRTLLKRMNIKNGKFRSSDVNTRDFEEDSDDSDSPLSTVKSLYDFKESKVNCNSHMLEKCKD